jgi:antitoxin (DNA-binding transcriptional repressor) of toxin-antitoxin stability system
MTERTISVTDAVRNFSDLINRAFYRGESVTLIRGGIPVARLTPPAPATLAARDLAERWPALPHLEPADAQAFAEELAEARRTLPVAPELWE